VPATLLVDLSGSAGGKPAFTTISAAVAQANSGDAIRIDAGTYVEQVTINATGANGKPIKSLTLQSNSPSASPVIQAPATLTGAMDIVEIFGANNVSLIGLTIQGPAPGLIAGVEIDSGGSAILRGDVIRNIQDSQSPASQSGIGVLVGGKNTPGKADISFTSISNYQKGGIVVEGAGSRADIENNHVTGLGPTGVIAQNGIEIAAGATAEVEDNLVANNVYTGMNTTGFAAAGIIALQAGPGSEIEGNVVKNSDVGIWVLDTNKLEVSENIVSGFDSAGISVDVISTGSSKLTIVDNWVKNGTASTTGISLTNVSNSLIARNLVTGAGIGIWLAGNDTKNTVRENLVTNNALFGILVADYDPTQPNGVGTSSTSGGNAFRFNFVVGNNTSQQNGIVDAMDLSPTDSWAHDILGSKSPTTLK
jgi:parallel beta-helix repeat protein